MDVEGGGSKISPKQAPPEPVKSNDVTQLRVLIFGPPDLGLEVARKLIEEGVRNLTLYNDGSKVKFESSSHLLHQYKSQPDLTQNDIVNQTIKSWTSLYPGVNVADRETNKAVQCDILKEYHIVVLTEFNWKFLQFCRQNKISVITAQTNGPFGRVLFDFAGSPPPTAPPLLRSSRLDPISTYDGASKAVAGADAGGKNEILDKTSLRLFEQFDGNRPAFAECPASKSNFVPTIHAAYTAFNRFKTKNASKSAVLNYETFRTRVNDQKLSQSKIEGKLLEEFHNHLERRIPFVNNYIGSVVAQEILKFWIKKSHPVHQQLILYGGEFRFPISFSKVSCDSYVGGHGEESSEDPNFVSPQIRNTGPSKNLDNMQSVPNPDQDQNMESETPQLSAPELVPESEPEPEPKPEPKLEPKPQHKPNSKPLPKPSELELPQTSGWEAAKSRKQKWSFNTNDKRSKKIAKQG